MPLHPPRPGVLTTAGQSTFAAAAGGDVSEAVDRLPTAPAPLREVRAVVDVVRIRHHLAGPAQHPIGTALGAPHQSERVAERERTAVALTVGVERLRTTTAPLRYQAHAPGQS